MTTAYPRYSMYLYIITAIVIAIKAIYHDVMNIIEMHRAKPNNDNDQ